MPSLSFRLRTRLRPLVAALCALSACLATSSCGDDELTVTPTPKLGPGEVCFAPSPTSVRAHFQPALVIVAPGERRLARLVVDPDFCVPTPVDFTSSAAEVVATPAAAQVDYAQPTVELEIVGGAAGTSEIVARVPRGDGEMVEAVLQVDVRSAEVAACKQADALAPTTLNAGDELAGAGTLAQARIALPSGADKPNEGSFLWSVGPFDVAIDCAEDLVPDGHTRLGAAVQFGPAERVFPREMPLAIPINPAAMPDKARWRHLRVVYSGPQFLKPRIVPVTDPRLEKDGDQWMLRFRAPRLGTYQALVKSDAGSTTRSRRLTHRAVIGISMGGAGTAQFGLRHHDRFDVIAPLGGPVDWTWMTHQIQTQHTGGFRAIAPGTQLQDIQLERTVCTTDVECQPDETCLGVLTNPATSGKCTLLPIPNEPYLHTQTFNTWWYEYPRTGHGGRFDREQYVQIFRDLALMFGNPNGYNPDQLNLPTGVDPNHPSQIGDHTNGECKIWIDPLDGPDNAEQKAIADSCPIERCQYTQVLNNYFDDEFNPDGTFPVITFCDGTPQDAALTPYANTWTPEGNNQPMEVALAVDYNGNGVRDELEPVIQSGNEPWDDWGTDMTPSDMETGWSLTNLDPAGDDYEPQYNPNGLEGDHRYQPGEAFRDYGLDGVMGTSSSIYDHGEGDGEFTAAPGLQRFWDYDAHSIVRQWPSAVIEPFDDEALARVDFWTDGGTRDLFNFLAAARHLTGTFVSRGRDTVYISDFTYLPGLDPSQPGAFTPSKVVYEDLQGVVMQRYGKDEPSELDIENGSGQHVGTANEIAKRLQSALYFISSRWPDAPRALVASSADKPAAGADPCHISGSCNFDFTATDGRSGPVAMSLPPGYGHADQQGIRYPVIYLLHGYGMTPDDLQAAIVFLRNWMNGPADSQHSRLAKAIIVYVDGRCRIDNNGQAECIRGSFFADSIRPDGPQMDAWWLELMDHIDDNFRTMPETTVEVRN